MKTQLLLVFVNILNVFKSFHSYILSPSLLFQSHRSVFRHTGIISHDRVNEVSSIILYAKKKITANEDSSSSESSSSSSSSPKRKPTTKKTAAGAKANLSDGESDTDILNVTPVVPKTKKTKSTPQSDSEDNNDVSTIVAATPPKARSKKSASLTSEPIASSSSSSSSTKKSSSNKKSSPSTIPIAGLPSSLDFDKDFAELEKSLKEFDDNKNIVAGSENDDLESTFRSIESGEFDIDALMKMAPQDMAGDEDDEEALMMMGDLGLDGLDLDLEDDDGSGSSIGNIMRNMGLGGDGIGDEEDEEEMGMFQTAAAKNKNKNKNKSIGGSNKMTDGGLAAGGKSKRKPSSKATSTASSKGSKKKKDAASTSYGDGEDGSSEMSGGIEDEPEEEEDEDDIDSDELTMLETGSKEVSESELFGTDEEESESLDDLADFDFSALSTRLDDDDDEEESSSSSRRGKSSKSDDDEEEEEDDDEDIRKSTKKSKKGSAAASTTLSSAAKGKSKKISLEGDDEEDIFDDSTTTIDDDKEFIKPVPRYDSNIGRATRETELAPSTIAAASGFAASGRFSSKEKAAAQASASAATRAASAKRKKELIAGGMSKAAATASLKKELEGGGVSSVTSGGADDDKLMIDGFEVDKKLGVPPPLEEFRRLMESLGAESGLFDDNNSSGSDEDDEDAVGADGVLTEAQKIRKLQREYNIRKEKQRAAIPVYTQEQLVWHSSMYEGGHPEDSRGGNRSDQVNEVNEDETVDNTLALFNITEAEMSSLIDNQFNEHTVPLPFRLLITSVVTSVPSDSGLKNTALDVVEKVYEHIKRETKNDERIEYQILLFNDEEDEPLEQLNDVIQMWCEGYNTYHLIDGSAMKAAWGGVIPAIVLSQGNLEALLNQVRWALEEDVLDGTLLTPRLRTVRLRGGAKDMAMGFNTDRLENEFSVVSVR